MKRAWVVLAATALPLLTGCGVGADGRPRDIAAKDAPLTLSANQTSSPGTTAAPGNPKVYLLSADTVRLVGSNRDVSSDADLLRALLAGPTPQDNAKGFTSAIPPKTTLVGTRVEQKIMTIELKLDPESQGFAGPSGPSAFAQLVFTATASGDKVIGVKFIVDGQAQGVDGNGRSVTGPLTRSDFSNLAPDPGSDPKPPGGTIAPTTTTSTTVALTTPATT